MQKQESVSEQIRQIRRKDHRYDEAAYAFLLEALEHTIRGIGERRHLTGQELSEGVREYSLKKFGLLARTVLESWGVYRTDDFGEIVFNMIGEGLMGKTEEDTREHFHACYDFRKGFDEAFRMEGQWKTPS